MNGEKNWLLNLLSDPIFAGILGTVGGVILTLVTKFGEGGINLFFENKKRKKQSKIDAAKDINAFCIEGMHKVFRWKAGSEQHIKLRATEIEAIDKNVGMKLRSFLDAWSQCRNIQKNGNLSLDDERLVKDYRDKAQVLGEELLEVARKWSG